MWEVKIYLWISWWSDDRRLIEKKNLNWGCVLTKALSKKENNKKKCIYLCVCFFLVCVCVCAVQFILFGTMMVYRKDKKLKYKLNV